VQAVKQVATLLPGAGEGFGAVLLHKRISQQITFPEALRSLTKLHVQVTGLKHQKQGHGLLDPMLLRALIRKEQERLQTGPTSSMMTDHSRAIAC
jgi:hypothetical protein